MQKLILELTCKNGDKVRFEGDNEQSLLLEAHTFVDSYNNASPFSHIGKHEIPELKELQDVLITPAVLDPETGEELEPAVYEQQEVVVRPYTPAEYTIEITDVTGITEAIEQIAEAKKYLSETDYMAIREFEGGEPMPIEVKTERAAKRALINSLETEFGL